MNFQIVNAKLSILTLSLILFSCEHGRSFKYEKHSNKKESSKRIEIFYESMRAGELEPCGCKNNPMGGLPRLKSLVNKTRKQNPRTLLINGGGLYLPARILEDIDQKKALYKAQAMSKLYNNLRPDFVLFSPDERRYESVLKRTSDNHQFASYADFKNLSKKEFGTRLKDKKAGWTSFKLEPDLTLALAHLIDVNQDNKTESLEILKKEKPEAELYLLLYYGSIDDLESLLKKMPRVDLVLLSSERRVLFTEAIINDTPVINSGFKGRYISNFIIEFDQNKKLPLKRASKGHMSYRYSAIALKDNYEDDPEIKKEIESFKESEAEKIKLWEKKQISPEAMPKD